MELGVMLFVAFLLILVVPTVVLIDTVVLRMLGTRVAGVEIGWPMALLTAVLAGFAQGCASGLVGGLDAGVLGTLVGWLAFSAMTAMLNDIAFTEAAMIGAGVALVHWLLSLLVVGAVLFTGAAAIVGIAALA